MIVIKVDNAKEMLWMQKVLESGAAHFQYPYILKALDVELNQTVTFEHDETFVDDVTETRDTFIKRFEGLKPDQIEHILMRHDRYNMDIDEQIAHYRSKEENIKTAPVHVVD
jgi:hypothetical protein